MARVKVGVIVLAVTVVVASVTHHASAARPAKEAGAGAEAPPVSTTTTTPHAFTAADGPSCCSNHVPCPPGHICPHSPSGP
ncbi:hypothetical protein E2562_031239 [Oryza meyeriana var. granulata]|uniref:Uncharacterized protein n=1 Tax=Oryza meyeriana var. granulata TaxID=110450 RepID=A0A6G1DQK0_9ORYZ|nr:hypothetical protein E2562_031239 [Oryza meyeriana var. granulata]